MSYFTGTTVARSRRVPVRWTGKTRRRVAAGLAEVRRSVPRLHLRILSANVFRAYNAYGREIRELVSSLGLDSAVHIENGADPASRGRGDAPLRLRRYFVGARDI